ncbi:hypothetical protein MSAN_01055800 [Mycena sanguinolenta]|uniref:F-box domain-containing protein n=1 Tax=Mycena sanguinolenta TaxID=230812 RepID=A0A8H7D910_9AGAR|nr:hypothetical protein MSAN_01055800 [Mycena sanguinolenta]
MTSTLFSLRSVVLEQKERTKGTSRADVERFIAESESKITSLESQISALVELRDRERDCVAALRHLISPIHTLPVELLSDIFERAICDCTDSGLPSDWPTEEEEDNDSEVSSPRDEREDRRRAHMKAVFQISQVCTDWRQVAYATPRLVWTAEMRINLRQGRDGDRDQLYADGLKTWLLRYAPLTIPISLHLRPLDGINYRILDDVLSIAPRYHSLRLLVTHYTPLSFVNRLAEARLENLEELDLGPLECNIGSPLPTAVTTTLTSFTIAPCLRKLGMSVFSNHLPALVPWAQLTHLRLHSIFFLDSVLDDILSKCIDLIQADLDTSVWFVLPQARELIYLTHLRRLYLSFFEEGRHFMPFLDCLSTPVLEVLRLNFVGMGFSPRWIQESFTAFQLRAPNITHLDLGYADLTSDDLRTAIRHAPSLAHLRLIGCDACIDDAFLDSLCYKAGTIPLAPHLHNLFIDGIVPDNFTPDILAGMIASRWWTDAESAWHLAPSSVARWTRVQLYSLSSHQYTSILDRLPPDVLTISR